MSKTKSSSPKKVTKRATKASKHSGPKISTPKTPKGVSDAMYKFMSEEHCTLPPGISTAAMLLRSGLN
jgi:hypothetical protein